MAGQRQDSLADQLRDLAEHARKEGMYDAHDWLLSSVVRYRSRPESCDVIFECSDVENGAHYRRCEFEAGHDGGHRPGEFVGVPYRKDR